MFGTRKFSEAGSEQVDFRVVKRTGIDIGAAIESTRQTDSLHQVGWSLDSASRLYALGRCYFCGGGGATLQSGQIVTVRVDVASKTIEFLVDGVQAGPHHKMKISDGDVLKLKPAVQLYDVGDSHVML